MNPYTKPNLFFAYKEMNIKHFHELIPTPVNTEDTRTELGVSKLEMKYRLEAVRLKDRKIWIDESFIVEDNDEDQKKNAEKMKTKSVWYL